MVYGEQIYASVLSSNSTPPIYIHLIHLLLSLSVLITGSFFHSRQRVCCLCLYHDANRVNRKKDYEYSIKTAMFLLNRRAAVWAETCKCICSTGFLCLIQFVQIRVARLYNYGLDKEIVLQNRTESYIEMVFVRKELHLFIHSFTQQALTEHLFHPVIVCGAGNTKVRPRLAELTDIWTDGHNILGSEAWRIVLWKHRGGGKISFEG